MMRVLHKKIKDKNQDKGFAQRDKRLKTQDEVLHRDQRPLI
jgi:hypothetical protein